MLWMISIPLYKEKNIECLYISASVIDQAIIEFLERKHDVKFQRVDGGYSDKILDPSREKGLLDSEGRSESARIAEWFRKKLSQENIEVEAKSLASETLPGFLMIKEEERRFRDSLLYRNKEFKNHSWVKPIFVINTNSKLIQSMQILDKKDPVLAKELANTVYDLACLSQKEMQPERLSQFIQQNIAVLEKLAKESKE
jgi:molecular chaperone HtpG